MKTITCRALGGMCDEPLSAETYEGLMEVGMKHLDHAHPDMAASTRAMPKDDPMMVEWDKKARQTWADTPDK